MRKKGIVVGIIILFIGAVVAPSISSISNQIKIKDISTCMVSFNPFEEGWKYRKEIIISHDEIEGFLYNFPVLISIVDSDLRDKAQVDGDDIVFTDYYDVILNHEIEYYNGYSGELVTWVNVTSLSPSSDTSIYMYYGNPTCSNQQNVEGTWSSDYVMVHHLHEASGVHYDSTSNNHDTSIVQVTEQNAVGKIAGADDFESDFRDYLEIPDSPDWDFETNPVTISMWVKMESARYIMFIIQLEGWELFYYYGSPKRLQYSYSNQGPYSIEYPWTYTTLKWYYFTYTRTGDTHSLYVNSELGISGSYGEGPPNRDNVVWIGKASEPYAMDGVMDEIRILNVGRSQEWIKTEYNNQDNPSDFFSVGLEEILNTPPSAPTIDGPIRGEPGVEYTYYANTTDPNGNQVYYKWDWGDNSYSEWLGPYDSGIEIPASHAWSQGNYEIRVKAKDIYGAESDWSDPFPITMPRDKVTVNSLSLRFLERFPLLERFLSLLIK